jgi:DNA-directed RNA polymerase specialized sigma24 family protein
MSSIGSLTRCVYDLRSPDNRMRDEAARVIWDRFSARLMLIVRRHLDNRILRREDEHDVLQSMFASFCNGQLKGMTAPASREELWKLLVRITMCKVVNTAHRHLAGRRDIRKEQAEAKGCSESASFPQWMLDHVDGTQPSPEDRIIVVEEFQRLLQSLPDEHRQIVVWKLEGFTNSEISHMINRTVRSVELKLQLIRKRLQDSFETLETTAAKGSSLTASRGASAESAL